jgi:hypothetical protein
VSSASGGPNPKKEVSTVSQTIVLSNGKSVNVPPGANPITFRRIEETRLSLLANPKPRKRTTRKASGKTTKRSQKAAMENVTALATLTLVERVNSEPAIPNSWYTVNRGDFTASVDQQTGEVSYKDNEQ